VLYEGRQIYFGNIHAAKSFFVNLGFKCPPRQVTGDFLTSLTSSSERRVRPGFEGKTPSTPDEFAVVWEQSEDRARLLQEIEEFDRKYPIGGPSFHEFKNSRRAVQARSQYVKAPLLSNVYSLNLGASNHLILSQSHSRWHCVFGEGSRGCEEISASSLPVPFSTQSWHW